MKKNEPNMETITSNNIYDESVQESVYSMNGI